MQYGPTESHLQVMFSSDFDCSACHYCSEKTRQETLCPPTSSDVTAAELCLLQRPALRRRIGENLKENGGNSK